MLSPHRSDVHNSIEGACIAFSQSTQPANVAPSLFFIGNLDAQPEAADRFSENSLYREDTAFRIQHDVLLAITANMLPVLDLFRCSTPVLPKIRQ